MAIVDGGGDATTADLHDNYWSDYAGFDLDADGHGDVAHEVKRLSAELTDTRPSLKLFRGTAALVTLDAVSQAVPVLATRLLLRGPRPRMAPHHLHEKRFPGPQSADRTMPGTVATRAARGPGRPARASPEAP